jgi:hypothetical protein
VSWNKDLLDEACADDLSEFLLSPLPLREGSPPPMLRGQPHRQLAQLPSVTLAKQAHDLVFVDLFGAAGTRACRSAALCVPCDSNLLVGAPSLYEGTGAKSLRYSNLSCCPAHIKARKGEWAHQHTMDKSWHVLLSPRDARKVPRKVLQAGWGETWPISCLDSSYGPPGYTLLFAPRDDTEIEVLLMVVNAAHKNSLTGTGGGNGSLKPTKPKRKVN